MPHDSAEGALSRGLVQLVHVKVDIELARYIAADKHDVPTFIIDILNIILSCHKREALCQEQMTDMTVLLLVGLIRGGHVGV